MASADYFSQEGRRETLLNRIKKHQGILLGVFVVFLLLEGLFLLGRTGLFDAVLWRFKVGRAAESGTPFQMKEMFLFPWDSLYLLHEPYSDGYELKEKYGLDFTIPMGDMDTQIRLLFFERSRLVKIIKLDKFNNDFALSVEQVFPEDTFVAEKRNGMDCVYIIEKQE